MIKEINVSSKKRYELVDITDKVEEVIRESEVKDGLVLVFVPHSTAAILLTENEIGLKEDWLSFFKKVVSGIDFKHNRIDNNADSHILSGLLGQTKALAVKGGKLVRGTWQQMFLVELDGPKKRRILVKTIEE